MKMFSLKPAGVGIIAALALSGCTWLAGTPLEGLAEKIPGVGGGLTQRVTEEMFADIADPLVRKNMVAMMNQGKFRMKSQFGMGGQTYISLTETEMKGENYNFKSAQEKGGELTGETMTIGDTTYVKDYTDNTWWKQKAKPVEVTEEVEEIQQAFTPDDMKELFEKGASSTFVKLAEEACPAPNSSLKCNKYEEKYPEGGSRIWWFDTKEYLTRREEMGVALGKTVTDYTYDNISITAPTPTKEVPEGKSIYEMQTGETYDLGTPTGEQPDFGEIQKQLEQFSETMPNLPIPEEIPEGDNNYEGF